MSNVIFKTNKQDWFDASLSKKELKFFRARNIGGRFDEAIRKEEDILRSFMNRAA